MRRRKVLPAWLIVFHPCRLRISGGGIRMRLIAVGSPRGGVPSGGQACQSHSGGVGRSAFLRSLHLSRQSCSLHLVEHSSERRLHTQCLLDGGSTLKVVRQYRKRVAANIAVCRICRKAIEGANEP